MLSDADKRKQYDQMRRLRRVRRRRGPRSAAGRRRARAGGGRGPRRPTSRGSISATSAGWATSSRRSSAAGGTGGAAHARRSRPSSRCPFRVAALGGKVPVTLQVTETCPTCAGSGGAPGATWSTCPECNGRGTISFGQGGFAVNRPCPQCRGRGRIPSEPCPTCRGAGEIRTERQVIITVPAGTETGTRVRHPRPGPAGARPAPRRATCRHLPGAARPLLPPRGPRHRLRGADQPRPGGARHAAPGPHARRQEGDAPDPGRHAAGPEVPDQGAGGREERRAGRSAGAGAGDGARAAHAEQQELLKKFAESAGLRVLTPRSAPRPPESAPPASDGVARSASGLGGRRCS